jgi:hypothetical protein
MSWKEQRDTFQKELDTLAQFDLSNKIAELDKVTGKYIATAGINQDPKDNPLYDQVTSLTNDINAIKVRYATVNDKITKVIGNEVKDNQLSTLLTENGQLQKHIARLQTIEDEIKVDVESAVARDEVLRSRDTNLTSHQLFLLQRPVRKGVLPYLWVISVLFIGVALILFKMTFPDLPTLPSSASLSIVGMTILFFENKFVLLSIIVSLLVVILFLGLKMGGVFGK